MYDESLELTALVKEIASIKQVFTQYGGMRPYGVAIMLGGVKKRKPHLYTTDVTGNYTAYRANAIGEHDEKVKEYLRRDYKESINIDDGIKFALKIFKDILGKNFEVGRFEVCYIKSDKEKLVRMQGETLKKFVK